jgi:hypothetical protein
VLRRSIRRMIPRPGVSWILVAVGFALPVGLHLGAATASTSAAVFVGGSQRASFRLEVDNTSQARLVIRFRSRSLRGRVRKEGLIAYCSWRRDGTSANPLKLGKKTAVAQVLLSYRGSLEPSVCGLRSVLKRVKTRGGRSEFLSLVVARMRRL